MISILKHLHELRVLIYEPVKEQPQITFVLPRQDAANLPLNTARMAERKTLIMDKMEAMVSFTTSTHRCRMQMIQDYFNEVTFDLCGVCDVCIARKKKENITAVEELRNEVLNILRQHRVSVEELEERIAPRDHELFVEVVRDLVDDGLIQYDRTWQLSLSQQK